jgi:hypothetical protein
MNRKIAFVLSDMRSGSTLLDQLLGAHPEVMSLGELHWLPAYVTQDRSIYDPHHELVCTCGRAVADCEFWTRVALRLGRPLDSLQLRPSFTRNTKRFLERIPGAFRHQILQKALAGTKMVDDSLDLIDCLFEVSGSRYLVDSSKSTYRFRAIHDARPAQSCGLVLTRDYRAVVHSKMKRGHSLEFAARGWRSKMRQIAALTDDLPREHIHQLSYESLCKDPVRELTRLCGFLGLAFVPAMLERPTVDTHHIGGSPSKFDRSRLIIAMDTAYQTAFSAPELTRLASLVGGMAARWGY